MFAPFGERFPGLAPAVEEELDQELMRRALFQYTRDARIGLVPAAHPADVLPRLGWAGAANHRTASELAVVLRSWEDRFGARLLEVGFADIRLLVSGPPRHSEQPVLGLLVGLRVAGCPNGVMSNVRSHVERAKTRLTAPVFGHQVLKLSAQRTETNSNSAVITLKRQQAIMLCSINRSIPAAPAPASSVSVPPEGKKAPETMRSHER